MTPDLEGADDDDQGSGGFNDGFVDENIGSDNGSDIDYSGRKEDGATKLAKPAALETAQNMFDKLPVVWSGTVSYGIRSRSAQLVLTLLRP